MHTKDPVRNQRAAFALATVLTAEERAAKLRAAVERLDAGSDAEFADALRNLASLAEDTEGAYRLAREAFADAAEAYSDRA